MLNEILVPLIVDNTSVDRSYPSGSLSRRAIACKLSDVLYIVAQRIGVDLLRQYLTEPLQLFFAVFSVSSSSSQAAAQAFSTNYVVNTDDACQQTASDHKGIVPVDCATYTNKSGQIWYLLLDKHLKGIQCQ